MIKKILICLVFLSIPLLAQEKYIIGMLKFDEVKSPIKSITGLGIAWDSASTFRDTIATNAAYTFSGEDDGQWITVEIFNNGSNTVTFTPTSGSVTWQGGTQPTQTPDKTDIYQFFKSGTRIFGMVIQDF